MGRLVLVCLVVFAGSASARRIQEPQMLRACPPTKTWTAMAECLAKLGTIKEIGVAKGGHLVELLGSEAVRTNVPAGVYLFAERHGSWSLAGTFFGRAHQYEILKFQRFASQGHMGFRIDIGEATPVELDRAPALMRWSHSMFCSGLRWACVDVMTSCEVLVRGKARFAFLGTLKIEHDTVRVLGDRRHAPAMCASPDQPVYLGWSNGG